MKTARDRKKPSKPAKTSETRGEATARGAAVPRSVRGQARALATRLYDDSQKDPSDRLAKAAAVVVDALELALCRRDHLWLETAMRDVHGYVATRTRAERWTMRVRPPKSQAERAAAVRHLLQVARVAMSITHVEERPIEVGSEEQIEIVSRLVSTATANLLQNRAGRLLNRARLKTRLEQRTHNASVLDPEEVVLHALVVHGVQDAEGWMKLKRS